MLNKKIEENIENVTETALPKELKKLSRADLLELLVEVTKENDRLNEEVRVLTEKLESRELEVSDVEETASEHESDFEEEPGLEEVVFMFPEGFFINAEDYENSYY